MPRQGRAFDAHRESLDAGQRLEPVDIVLQRFGRLTRLAAGDARVELRKERSRFSYGLPSKTSVINEAARSRSRSRALEADIGDAIALTAR
jgi:hypothetical protein